MRKEKFNKKQGLQLSIFAGCMFGLLSIMGAVTGDIPLCWGACGTVFFAIGGFVIGGLHDPNDPNPQD